MTTIEASIWLGEQQVKKLYRYNPTVYISSFCNGQAMRKIMSEYYRILTDRYEIAFLESLETDYKAELKMMTLEMGGGKLDRNGLMDLANAYT